jgi:hypothetical protein
VFKILTTHTKCLNLINMYSQLVTTKRVSPTIVLKLLHLTISVTTFTLALGLQNHYGVSHWINASTCSFWETLQKYLQPKLNYSTVQVGYTLYHSSFKTNSSVFKITINFHCCYSKHLKFPLQLNCILLAKLTKLHFSLNSLHWNFSLSQLSLCCTMFHITANFHFFSSLQNK